MTQGGYSLLQYLLFKRLLGLKKNVTFVVFDVKKNKLQTNPAEPVLQTC